MSIFEQHSDLILSLAKFTSALLIAFAVAPFLKRPALRATFWAAMLIILPTVIFATHGSSILNILPQLSPAPETESFQPVAEVVVISAVPADLAETPRIASQAPARKTNWVATVLFTGMAVSFLPILISILRIRFIPKKPAGVSAMDVWAKIRPQESPPVPLYLTSSPSAPFTAGLIREAVLLPESSTGWSLRRLRSTLYHEAAHITRKDPLVRMFASLVRVIFWFHPLVWMAHRQLVAAQEEACDEIALAAGIPADEYAEDLLETAKYSQATFGHGLNMARWSQLGHRVRLILQNNQTEPKPLTMKTIAIVSLGIAATTFGLSSLGFSQAPNAVDKPTELETSVTATASAVSISSKVTAVAPGAAVITKKLNEIIIPRLDFEDTTLEEAIAFLRMQAVELDVAEKDPAKKGINIVIRRPRPANEKGDGAAAEAADLGALRINELRLANVPVGIALKYVCDQTKMKYKVDDFAVSIVPIADAGEDLFTRTFRVPPGFAATLGAGADVGEIPITELLKKASVVFPKGSSATINPGALLVTNTPTELDKIEQLVEAAKVAAGPEAIIEIATLGGQVRKPGPVNFQKGMTLYQAIQEAGGSTEFGSLKRVKLYRNGKVVTYDLTKPESKAIPIEPDDTIEVPQKNFLGE